MTPLSPEALSRRCDPEQFSFETTADLEELAEVIGQDRAVAAIQFGIGIQREGYNLFAIGPSGTGKYTSVHRSLEKKAAEEAVPSDWCYVFNFENPQAPNALELPAGQANELQNDMHSLVEELFAVIPGAFEGEEYDNQKRAIEAEVQEKQESAIAEIQEEAKEHNIALIRTPSGLAFAPLRGDEVIKPEEFKKLPEARREEIEAQIGELQERLQRAIRQVPQWIRQNRSKVKELNEEVASYAVAPLFAEIKEQYGELPEVLAFLDSVQKDIVEHNTVFVNTDHGGAPQEAAMLAEMQQRSKETFASRYYVNVVIDHSQTQGAPIVYEQNPTFQNLIGRLEHVAQMGTLLTDFSLIKPGSLHRASGGYLIVDARKMLLQPYAWEGLKQALRSGEIRIESPGQALGLVTTIALEPEPIPLKVKIVLMGDHLLYYLMHEHDPDFSELFKVEADFDDQMERNEENNLSYAQLIGTLARKEELRHFDRAAVARVIEYSAREAGDAEKLSAHMQSIADLLREADYWAGDDDAEIVGLEHVKRAIDAQIHRSSRIKERMQESIIRETILIDTAGGKVGQINALSVLALGNFTFGRPSRITARVRIGKGEVLDIERQVELGGPLHSKGVLILSSYLGSRYASDRPLSLSASLVFEQSYGGVDGDSASSAELYALLSALAEAPIKQSLAVTGSVNQYGQVQAIGGVNEKIEGFYDVCDARGLTGDQGVLIPGANVKHLMLRQDIVDSVAAGKFHIYAIDDIEQGIEVLTGIPAGEADDEGVFPEGSINQRVVARLEEMTETQREFSGPPEEDEEESGAADGDGTQEVGET